MSLPKSYRAYRRTPGDIPRSIEVTIEHLPTELGSDDVIIKIHAISLNFRDVGMLDGRYMFPTPERGIPASDAAAEVMAIGSNVKNFKIGDRVSPVLTFKDPMAEGPGAELDKLGDEVGVLAEYAVFNENALVHIPKHLSWEEAATIPCCGVTAWNSLNRLQFESRDPKVFLQGTGGVSMLSLVLCIAAGVVPIISSSSDKKLDDIRTLSSLVKGFNYKSEPDTVKAIRELSGGVGVDIVVNNTGVAAFPTDLECLRNKKGTISLVGFLDQEKPGWDYNVLYGLIVKDARLQGIRGGNKFDAENLNRFLEEKGVKLDSIIDRIFDFDDAKAAFDHLGSGKHIGKVVIKVC